MENYYVALNCTDTLQNDNEHIMVKIQLHRGKESVTINGMIDSGATEDFIDREVHNKQRIKMIKATNSREMYLVQGKPSAMGPVTQLTKVPMDISSQRGIGNLTSGKSPEPLGHPRDAMVKRTQSNDRLERQKDYIQQ